MSTHIDNSSVAANRRIVEAFIGALGRQDVAAILAAYHPEATIQTMGNTLISGLYPRDQIEAFAGGILEAFPEGIEYTVHTMVAEADCVAVEASVAGLHSSGGQYTNDLHFLFRLRDGKIISLKEYLDTERVTEVLCGGQRPGGAT